jgi:hypothetical protein
MKTWVFFFWRFAGFSSMTDQLKDKKTTKDQDSFCRDSNSEIKIRNFFEPKLLQIRSTNYNLKNLKLLQFIKLQFLITKVDQIVHFSLLKENNEIFIGKSPKLHQQKFLFDCFFYQFSRKILQTMTIISQKIK